MHLLEVALFNVPIQLESRGSNPDGGRKHEIREKGDTRFRN